MEMNKKRRLATMALSVALAVPGVIATANSAAAIWCYLDEADDGTYKMDPLCADLYQVTAKTRWTKGLTNVRTGPGSNTDLKEKLPKGTQVEVSATKQGWSEEKHAKVSWTKISTGGWIRSDLLSKNVYSPPPLDSGDCSFGGASVKPKTKTALYNSLWTNTKKIGTIPKGTELFISAAHGSIHCDFAYVESVFDAKTKYAGYVNIADLEYADIPIYSTYEKVYLRDKPSEKGKILATIPKWTPIRLSWRDSAADDDYWFKTEYKGQKGWAWMYLE